MLKNRILSTLKFFDLQDYPVTLLELHKFLLADVESLKTQINTSWEFIDNNSNDNNNISIDEIARCLDGECRSEIEQKNGFYCLCGRANIIGQRLDNYFYGIKRERRIRKYISGLRHVPFVRGVALAGSQAMGQNREFSDIDLLIIVEPEFLWLARTGVTAYFQFLGKRRHGHYIADRFCLNHYLAGVKKISEFKNLYTAGEYAKLRPLVYGEAVAEFQTKNCDWIAAFLPQFEPLFVNDNQVQVQSSVQKKLEAWLGSGFGRYLEKILRRWQLPKIRQEEFILVREDELSFHPQSKQQKLLQQFFVG